ncbi:hypothetical protein ACLOJK_036449 [Asimina triloba]
MAASGLHMHAYSWVETVAAANTCSPELPLLRMSFPCSRKGEIRSDLTGDEEDDRMQLSFPLLVDVFFSGLPLYFSDLAALDFLLGSPVNDVVLLALMRVVGISHGNNLLLVGLVFAGSSASPISNNQHFQTKETDGFDGSARSQMGFWLGPPEMGFHVVDGHRIVVDEFSIGIDEGGWSVGSEMGLMVDEQGWRRFKVYCRRLLPEDGDARVIVAAADVCSRSGNHGSADEEDEVFDMAV